MPTKPTTTTAFASLFPVVHGIYTELHPLAADICCALAASNSNGGLIDRTTVHVGAGYGADMRIALLHGAQSVLGLEIEEHQCKLATMLPDELWRSLHTDPVVSRLYDEAIMRTVVRRYRAEWHAVKQMLPFPPPKERYSVIAADVTQADVRVDNILDRPRDVLIGNMALHWLVRSMSVESALDALAPLVMPGGVAVFSVPYHLVEAVDAQKDEWARQRTIHRSVAYSRFNEALFEILGLRAIDSSAPGKVSGMLIKDSDIFHGSSTFQFEQMHTRYIAPLNASVYDVLRGLGMFEAMLATKRKAEELVDIVFQAINRSRSLGDRYTDDEDTGCPGTFVRFYVLRRCEE